MKKLFIVLILLLLYSCPQDDCTKLANKQKVTAGMVLKSSSSKMMSSAEWSPSSENNPIWLTWWNKDSISGGVHSGAKLNAMGEYEASAWAGMPETITIKENNRLYISSTNFIVNGNILGNGRIEFDNSPSKLIVRGVIDDNIEIVYITEGHTIQEDKPLSDNDSPPSWKYNVEVPCDFTLPQKRLEDGVWYYYTEYDGTGVRQGTSFYKGKL